MGLIKQCLVFVRSLPRKYSLCSNTQLPEVEEHEVTDGPCLKIPYTLPLNQGMHEILHCCNQVP